MLAKKKKGQKKVEGPHDTERVYNELKGITRVEDEEQHHDTDENAQMLAAKNQLCNVHPVFL